MEFIKVEQFQEQPLEVQKVFLDWWNEHITDYDLVQDENRIMLYKNYLERGYIENDSYPLFTEGQIRKFIEDKIGGRLDVECSDILDNYSIYNITVYGVSKLGFEDISLECDINAGNLLQAYWEVACMIAKEEVDG